MSPPEASNWFDALAEGVLLHDGSSVTGLNASAASLLDVERTRAIGRPLISVLRDHRLEGLARAPGSHVELELRGRPVAARSLLGALILHDVSEARASERSAKELIAVLSHELRTPAAAVTAVLDALATDLPEERRAYFVGRARDEARRLERLLADLTVDSRPPRERTVELAGVLERAAGLTSLARRARGIELRIADTDLAVWADEDKLLQALINLLENAAVHGPPDATVEVEVRREGPVARVEVLDEGVAYPAERYERLFEPRAQGGPKAKGTGLGLYIVRSVATDWGGEAWGGPRLGAKTGNSFGISVPLAPRQG